MGISVNFLSGGRQGHLPARMQLLAKQLRLIIDDADANYPLTIDPSFEQQDYLKASNTDGADEFGSSVAISNDTLVVGARVEASSATDADGDQSDNSVANAGAAYVFFDGSITQDITINAGHAGAWFNTATSGQGQFIDVEPVEQFMFISWFTFGEDITSGQRWLTAQGSFKGSIAEIDVFETTGGSFDHPQPPSTTNVGTMRLDFTDCSNALLTYSLPANGAEGDIAITRVIPGGQALCEELGGGINKVRITTYFSR